VQLIFTKDGVVVRQSVPTPFGESIHEETYKYETLPRNGLKLVITGITPRIEKSVLKEILFEVSHFEISKEEEKVQKIEVVLPESALRYNLINIPKKFRRLFPGYKIPFILETNAGEIETYIVGGYATDKTGDPDAGTYFTKGLSKWYKFNKDIKVGDTVIIEVIEPYKRYRLSKKD